MTQTFNGYVTAVETMGVAILRNTWSPKLRQRLAMTDSAAPNLRTVREAYDGLPMRVAQHVAGEQIFSGARHGVDEEWHRSPIREGVLAAPTAHVLGMSIAGPADEAVELHVATGSDRCEPDLAVGAAIQTFRLEAGDVAVLDARCLRRWTAPATIFELSVVRFWVEPVQDGRALAKSDMPPRARRFVGEGTAPTTLEEWLFGRHPARSEDAAI